MSEFGVRGQNSASEFFFRVTDRLQMESCLTALVNESQSVVISSHSNELIDYYGAAFVRRIKQKLPGSQLEVFLPRDTEAMLERFNQLLNTLSLDVATKQRSGASPERVWVVHDANAMGGHEIQLLTRLIQQFPGAGISVVLMFTQGNAQGETIANQNKQFIAWTLDLPTAEQKLAAIQQARKSGLEDEAVDFFNRLTKSAIKRSPQQTGVPSDSQNEERAPSKQVAASTPRRTGKNMALGMVFVGLLAISAGVGFWMNPEAGDQVLAQATSMLKSMTDQNKASEDETKNKAEPTAVSILNNGNKEVPPGPPAVLQLEPDVELPSQPAPAPAAKVAASTSPADNSVSASAPATVASNSKVITEIPEVAIQGRLWLKSLPKESYVLEHQNFATVNEARAFMKDKEWLVNSRIAPVFTEGKDEARFAVMTGPYRSVDRAKNTITRLKLPTNVIITSVNMATNQSEPNKVKP
jgi:hypothetical protein